MQLLGVHHLTAISADIRGNYRFYTDVLGMRLVKRSVNQDDVSAYHLFYADAEGSPGTDLTFFDWPAPPERRGTRAIVRTHLRVAGGLDWWRSRLDGEGVTVGEVVERDGRATLDFQDTEGQRLSLVDDGGAGGGSKPWDRSPVPADRQIRGLGPIVLSVPRLEPTDRLLRDVLNMRHARRFESDAEGGAEVVVYEMGDAGLAAELHVAEQPDLAPARQGAGGVHHVAFRTPDEEEYQGWIDRLSALGIASSGAVDRYYFKSLYFREPNGILFEIATDGPGFAVDEDPSVLGETLALPPFLEPHRRRIEANLRPID